MNSLPEKPLLECGNCSLKDRWLLHHVRLQGERRRLCTSCVLKLHRSSFCPICFDLFEGSVPNHARLICGKCRSGTHTHCVSNSENVAKPYTCRPCSDPKFAFFDAKRTSDDKFEIDVKSAKVLLCTARISAESMRRAVLVAEADAQRRVKEAAASRKRAKEALEELAAMVAREKVRKVKEYISGGAGSANGVDRNGVGISGRDNVVAGSSAVVPSGSSSQIALQNRASTASNVLGSGRISGSDNVVARSSAVVVPPGSSSQIGLQNRTASASNQSIVQSDEDAGRNTPAGVSVPTRPMNAANAGDADGKHGSSSPCRPAEGKK